MTPRNKRKFKGLFGKLCQLVEEQDALYGDKICLPAVKKPQFDELQIKIMSILDEMDSCFYETSKRNTEGDDRKENSFQESLQM